MTQPEKDTLETTTTPCSKSFVRFSSATATACFAPRVARKPFRRSAFRKTIHLLLSDVMMADMSGPVCLQMLVMMMSGYPAGDMLFRTTAGISIEKPFVPNQLAARVNDALA